MNGTGPLDRAQPLDLSTLQGRARAQTPCLTLSREGSRRKTTGARLPWWVTIKQAIVIHRLRMESNLAQVNAGKMHATGSGPSGLGMMQPEGRPQQGKRKT